MGLQEVRRKNLREAIRELEVQGFDGWVALADALGNPVTPERLRGAVEGREISPWLAERIEHVLGKPRGWMDEAH